MCIIVVKPAGVELPDTLENCWDSNSDGAGFMFPSNGKILVRKGFMDFDSFMDSVREIKDVTNTPIVMHFRIKTHGEISQQLTHPFVITQDEKHCKALRARVDRAFVHNGVITKVGVVRKGESDTSQFVTDYLSLLFTERDRDYHLNKSELKLVYRMMGSKGVIMNRDGSYQTIGDFVMDDGCLYSNTGYKYSYKHLVSSYKVGRGANYNSRYDTDLTGRALPVAECNGMCESCYMREGTYCWNYEGVIKSEYMQRYVHPKSEYSAVYSDETNDEVSCDGNCLSCDKLTTTGCACDWADD